MQENTIEQFLSEGHKHAQAGEMTEAIKCFRQAVIIDLNSVEARFWLGTALQWVGLIDEAIKQFEEVLHLDQLHRDTYSALAGCLLAKYLQKETELESTEEIFNDEMQTLFQETEKYSAKAIEMGDTEAYTFTTRALALAYLGRGEEAYQMTSKAHEKINEEGRELFANKLAELGLLYVQKKRDQSNGRWCLLAAQKLNPQDPSVMELEGELEMFNRSSNDTIANKMAQLVNLCENSPDKGLETIQSLIEKDSDPRFVSFLKFCRAMAYGSKGLFLEMKNKSCTEILFPEGNNELREKFRLTEKHLDYLEFALQEIYEIENTNPGFLKMLGTNDERTGECRINTIAACLERCRPGRTQQILGKNTLLYFGDDRVIILPKGITGRSINPDDLIPFMSVFFSSKFIAKSALVTHHGVDGDNIGVQLFEKTFEEFGPEESFGDVRPTTSLYDVKLFDDGTYQENDESRKDISLI